MSTRILSLEPVALTSPLPAQEPAPSPAPNEIVLQAAMGYIVSSCLGLFVQLGLPDLMGSQNCEVSGLAQQTGAYDEYLFRILRALEPAGIVRRTGARSFALTAAGASLRRAQANSLAPAVEWLTDPLHFQLYGHLRESVETGATTFDSLYSEPFFSWVSRKENENEADVFNSAMTSISEMCIPAFLEAYDFSPFRKLIDIGGGHGAVLRAILKKHPHLQGAVAEMENVIPQTASALRHDGLADRGEAVACNFFEEVPAGGDAYFMKNIVHDWADEPALRLLRNVRAVMPQHGRLILAECVLDESPNPHPGKLLDIEMIVFVGGKERTMTEFRQLLLQAGFQLKRVIPTRSPLSLLEAAPL